MPDYKQKFYDITHLVQREFDRNLELYGDKIQCRKGCSKCCSQIFRITALDGWIISEHVKSLPEQRQAELKQKAREYIKHLPFVKGESPQGEGFETKPPLIPPLIKGGMGSVGLPCPALGAEGECTIYEARPVICRRFGMPIYDYKNPENIHACELNFKDGEEITDNMLIPNQTEIGKKWDELKNEFGEGATTIAEAILNG